MDAFDTLFGGLPETDDQKFDELARKEIVDEDIQLRSIDAFSVNAVFAGDRIDTNALQEMLADLLDVEDEKDEREPTKMVRAFHGGTPIWLTLEQANTYLALQPYQNVEFKSLQLAIRRALKGNVRLLRQEVLVVLAIAFSGIRNYTNAPSADPEKAREEERALRKAWGDISHLIVEITSAESRLKATRKEHPQIESYEVMFGEFLNARQTGNTPRAEKLRKELLGLRKSYLAFSGTMEPDMQVLHDSRERIQQILHQALATLKTLAGDCPETLQIGIETVAKEIEKLKSDIVQSGGLG